MTGLPGGVGLWSGFLDRLASEDAVEAVCNIERAGIGTVWLQEFSGVDPFVRAALYLGATDHLTVALGVATIHARDAEALVAAASTLHEAFPGRFVLGLGVSHRQLAQARGATYERPLAAMRDYLNAMDSAVGGRTLPPRFLGALGPKMVELAGRETAGLHTYFAPVAHTAAARDIIGDAWLAPSQMVVLGGADDGWRDRVRPYLGMCLAMPNYRANLRRYGFDDDDLDAATDELVEALAVPDYPDVLSARLEQQFDAGADHVSVQFVPPPDAATVLARVDADPRGFSSSGVRDRVWR